MGLKKLGFGCMRLPLENPDDYSKIDLKQMEWMVDTFLKRGFSYFDTAYPYHNGQSEIAIREALVKRHPRDSFFLADKLPTFMLSKKEDMERIFNEQLARCGVEYFDYYLLHALTNSYEQTKKLDCFAFVNQKKAEGKINKVGFSFHDHAELLNEILMEHPEMDFVQLQINYLDWESESIQSRKCYEVCVKHGKPVIVMEPVKGGTLADVPEQAKQLMKNYAPDASQASWAIRYTASLQNVLLVLSGMSNATQLDDNTGYMQDFKELNREEYKILAQVTEMINESIAIPCTGCRYCVEGCPQKIAIPEFFALYNTEKQFGGGLFSMQKIYYGNYLKTHGKASSCVQCRQCEEHCPQHLPITAYLEKVAAVLE